MTFDSTAQAGADGSARVAHGLTEVLVSVFGPREARVRAQTLHDRAAIHVEATIAPFSTSDRRRRGRGDKCVLSPLNRHSFQLMVFAKNK
jgi:exosome complex component RRP41